jgi:hypothetical protein
MAAIDQPAPARGQSKRADFLGAVSSCWWTIIVLLACGVIAWLVGAWIAGWWGPSQPPASVDKPPLAPNALNVVEVQNGDPDSRIITYDTTISPAAVYNFYEQTWRKMVGTVGKEMDCSLSPN